MAFASVVMVVGVLGVPFGLEMDLTGGLAFVFDFKPLIDTSVVDEG